MDSVLRALSFSERGVAQMNNSDKACSIMECDDDHQSSFTDIREIRCTQPESGTLRDFSLRH
jgi:hypothetical protein